MYININVFNSVMNTKRRESGKFSIDLYFDIRFELA